MSRISRSNGAGHRARRLAAVSALACALSASAVAASAGSALAGQYPPGSLYGTQYGVVPSDSTPGGQVQTMTNVKAGLVADDANNSDNAGTQMIQWGANGGYNQNWVFVPSTGANAGYDEIQNRQSGLCLDVSGASTAQDQPVIQWTCTGAANQQWQIQSTQVSGVYLINNKNSGGSLAVSGGENNGNPGAGAGLVQDVNNSNYTDTWKLSLTSYDLLTNMELDVANSNVADETAWACVSGYHFRMASPAGVYDYTSNDWSVFPQAYIDQPADNAAAGGSNTTISTNQGPNGGHYLGMANDPVSESWTNAIVSSTNGFSSSDPNPNAAISGHGTVSIDYYHSGTFNWQDLDGQVHLYCDSN